tara:strand:- start:65 stop:178 length:114 start_codon:yes stop_codon:yes gene_type:complete
MHSVRIAAIEMRLRILHFQLKKSSHFLVDDRRLRFVA